MTYKCDVDELVKFISKKNLLSILRVINENPMIRYNQIQQILHLSPTTITQSLSLLQERDFIKRFSYAEVPTRVEYEITSKGNTLASLLDDLYHEAKNKELL